jgi:hypothetical protein
MMELMHEEGLGSKTIKIYCFIFQLQLFLAGVPGQSGLAAATHAVVGRDSDSGAAWMATSAKETALIMTSATLRNALQVSRTIASIFVVMIIIR